jgi:hypothetical protein
MAITDIGDRHPAERTGCHKPRAAREPSAFSSLAMCLLAAILLGVAGWIAFELLLTLLTLD